MRAFTLSPILAILPYAAHATAEGYSPFSHAIGSTDTKPLLAERGICPINFNSCGSFGFSNACCQSGTNCAFDQANHLACCPINDFCTGTVGGIIFGTATSTSSTSFTTIPTTTPFQPVTSVTAGPGGGTTISGGAYPFVFIPFSFPNAASCSAAYSFCQAESTSCFVSLAGAYGVTVTGPGISGIAQTGVSGTALSLAASTCSLYYSSACDNIQLQDCTANGAGPRPTACPAMVYAACAGAVMGALGAFP